MAEPPAFLHRSFQHEILVEPCGYTNVAVVQAPESTDQATIDNASKNAKKESKRRWLVYVDKKRGLLGRTVIACPAQDDPPPGRRRSYDTFARPTPGTSGKSISRRENTSLPGVVDLPLVSDDRQDLMQCNTNIPDVRSERSLEHSFQACRDNDSPKGGRSLPLLGENAAGTAGTGAWSATVEEGNIGGADKHVMKDSTSPKAVHRAMIDGDWKTVRGSRCGGHSFGATAKDAEETGRSFDAAGIEGKNKRTNEDILLDGLSRPFLVAAPAQGSIGVFFIDQLPSAASAAERSSTTTAAAQGMPNTNGNNQVVHGDRGIPSRASPRLNLQTIAQYWQLRFLRWGARQAITLVDKLYKPIALCVGSSDSSVFVLEEIQERRSLHRGEERYRVSRLVGSCLSERLKHGEIKKPVAANSRQDASTDGLVFPDSSESETDWDSSSTDTENIMLVKHDNQDPAGSSIGACEVKKGSKRPTDRSRSRRSIMEFVQVLEFSSASILKRGMDRAPEQPVDLCVLRDGTIFVAFSRSTPLHDGVSIAESQGVLRAFPARDRSKIPGRSRAYKASSIHAVKKTVVETSVKSSESSLYFDDDSWLVAEKLPVITGLAACGGEAIYLALCGARHDGTVTAIGSLSTRRPYALRVDTRREDLRSRKFAREGKENECKACTRVGNSSDVAHSREKFVSVVSGYAAALTVDDKMNLFYVTAESRGTCRALWCSVPGAGNRRITSIRGSSPTARVTTGGVSRTITEVLADSAGQARRAEEHAVGDQKRSGSCGRRMEGQNSVKNGGRCDLKEEFQAGSTAAEAAATVEKETKRAIALSMALVEDDEAVATSRMGTKELFTSRHRSRGSGRTEEVMEVAENEQDSNEPVNIVVVSRCRPLLREEIKRGVKAAVFCDGDQVVVSDDTLPKRSRRFGFDRVFGPGTSQARVYVETVCPVVRKMLDGFNCSVLAYGQTGSGKTFTMEGGLLDPTAGPSGVVDNSQGDSTSACEVEQIGIIPRAVHTIFREGGGGGTRRYWVYVSHMEIYNERLFDLLAPEVITATSTKSRVPSPRSLSPVCRAGRSPEKRSHRSFTGGDGGDDSNLHHRTKRSSPAMASLSPKSTYHKPSDGSGSGAVSAGRGKGLTIEEDRRLGVIVKGLTQVEVKRPEEIFAIIARSKSTRRTAETMCNVESSRSHGVFCVRVISAEPMPWGGEITRDGRLSLVDLSGSENIKRSGAVGDRAKEAAAIGQSLLALGRVIKALVQHAPHIPYRESKLTRVLGDSLGGNAFTAIILNITPNSGMLDETLNTLAYAKTAQSVRNTPKQHITNKAPTDEATTEGGGANPNAPETTKLSCNIANELRRWRGGGKSRLLSSRSRRGAHVRPWESGIPIRSHLTSLSSAGNPQKSRRRPATAGGIHTSLEASAGDSRGNAVGRNPDSGAHPLTSVTETGGLEMSARRGLGESAVPASPAYRCASEHVLTSTNGDRHAREIIEVREFRLLVPGAGERTPISDKAVTRIFDSTAAEWVHTVVLQRQVDLHARKSYKARHTPVKAPDTGQKMGMDAPAAQDGDSLDLTTAAKRALEEVFDRYTRGAPSRGFLLSAEVASLQEIWTRPDSEPPPPCQPNSNSPSDLLLNHSRSKAPQRCAMSSLQHQSPTSSSPNISGGSPNKLASGDNQDTRVLSRDAFIEFCRNAAARDAIFVRHFFVKTGYDNQLELPSLPPRDKATEMGPSEGVSVTPSSSTRPKKAYIPSGAGKVKDITMSGANETKAAVCTSGQRESREKGGRRSRTGSRRDGSLDGGNCGRGVEMRNSFSGPRSQGRGLIGNENEGIQPLPTGGLVDANELWLWMEDERDRGEQQLLDGLLSRGGGAHISRAAAR